MRILAEFFEATGYDTPGWTEAVSGGSIVNEDESSVNAGSPPNWGAQCLLLDHVTLTNSLTYNILGATPVTFSAVELVISAQGLPDGDVAGVVSALDAGLVNGLWAVALTRTAGVTSIEARPYYDGTAHIAWSEELVLNKLYRFEFMWDTTADLWKVWVNGFLVNSGTLTGSAATTPVGAIFLGLSSTGVPSFTVRLDRIEIDDNVHIGPDAGEFVNPTGSPQQVQTGFGWR